MEICRAEVSKNTVLIRYGIFRLRDCVIAERMECAQKCKIEIQLYEKEIHQRSEIE